MAELTSFPIQTKTIIDLDLLTNANTANDDKVIIYDESVGVWKAQTIGERDKAKVLPIDSIATFPSLDESTFTARQQFYLGSFAPNGQTGGGLMVWEPDIPKLLHNGINYFSPTVPIPADFDNATDVQNYKDGVGEEWPANNGVFVIGQIFTDTVDTVADLATLSLPIGSKVSTKGCLSIGDGGQGSFIVEAASGSPDGYSRVLLADGNYAVLQPVNGQFNLLQFGAVDGEDCDAAINLAKTVSAATKNKILVPEGTFTHNGFVVTVNDVSFVGANKELSILKLADGINTHGCEIAGDCNNISLVDLTIDQNRSANLTGGHGIRFGGSTNVLLDNIRIANCRAYGIGMQAGTQQHIKILNTTIAEAGLDGIDIKDFNEDNDDIYIGNLTVINHGLDEIAKPAIDWRGKLTVDGLHVSTTAAETIGIRARLESTQGKAASGNVDNITLICAGVATNANAIVLEGSAVATDIPRQVNINNVRAVGYQRIGLFGNRTIANIRNVSAEGITGDCFLTFCAGVTVDGLRVTSCDRVFNAQADTTGFKIRDAVVEVVANASLFSISSGATNVQVDDADFPSGKNITDNSGNTTIRFTRIKNYIFDKKVLQSAALSIDSTGSKIFDLAHGLPFTPRITDVQLTITRDVGAVADHRVQLLQVDAVNGTFVSGRMVVTTASATAGATVKVTAKVETKYSI